MSDSFPNSLMSGHLNENGLTHATHLSFCQQTLQNALWSPPICFCWISWTWQTLRDWSTQYQSGIRNISFWGGVHRGRGNIFWCWFIESPTFGFIWASIKSLVPVWNASRIKDLHDIVWRPWPWACLDLVIILTIE